MAAVLEDGEELPDLAHMLDVLGRMVLAKQAGLDRQDREIADPELAELASRRRLCEGSRREPARAHLPAPDSAGYSRSMNATLTLDADVATLLERAQKEHGRSLEELGNELLRRKLRQLATSPRESESTEPEAAQVPDPSQWLARVRQRKSSGNIRLRPAEILRHRDSDRR